MAKKLILVRHAKSSWKDQSLEDIDRPLNERGKRDTPRMGHWLLARLETDGVKRITELVSPAKRTQETCDLLDRVLSGSTGDQKPIKLQRHTIDALYGASPRSVLDMVRKLDEDCLMIIGHDPCMHDLYEFFSGDPLNKYPTCAISIFDFDMEDWSDFDGTNVIHREMMTPKKLHAQD